MIISTDVEKILDKIKHPYNNKKLSKQGTEEKFFHRRVIQRAEYLHKLSGILLHRGFLYFLPFIYLFKYLYQYGLLDIYFILGL